MSSIGNTLTFPKITRYLNFTPLIEFTHQARHINTQSSITRLSQFHVNQEMSWGILSVGRKRLSFHNGQFISDSKFNFTPRVFNQFSFYSSDYNFRFFTLFSYLNSGSETTHHFKKGGYIFEITPYQHLSLATFILEDIGDTYFISTQSELFSASLGLQKTPSIQSKQSSLTKQSYYYDFDYNIYSSDAKLTIGSRFFVAQQMHMANSLRHLVVVIHGMDIQISSNPISFMVLVRISAPSN